MRDEMNEADRRRSGLGLRELSEDLQDLGQVTLNLAGDVLHLATALISLPFQILPAETRTHLKNAATEAGKATQAMAESAVDTLNTGVKEVSRSLRWSGDTVIEGEMSSNAEYDDSIIIEDDVAQFGNEIESEMLRVGDPNYASDIPTGGNDSDAEVLDRERVDPNLEG